MQLWRTLKRQKRESSYIKQWAGLKSEGQGVNDFVRVKTDNVWLEEYNLLKPSRFINALRLRTNTFGARTVLARADNKIHMTCRKCRAQPETLGYVLGLCQYTKSLRIKRHDEAKSILADNLKKGNEVFVEPTLRVGSNLFKPDLVVKDEERVLVVDVTVRYENKDYLQKAEKEKIYKYLPCLDYLKSKLNVSEGEILPVVLDSRGAITLNTLTTLKLLSVPDRDIKTIIINVLRSSIEMCNVFLAN